MSLRLLPQVRKTGQVCENINVEAADPPHTLHRGIKLCAVQLHRTAPYIVQAFDREGGPFIEEVSFSLENWLEKTHVTCSGSQRDIYPQFVYRSRRL